MPYATLADITEQLPERALVHLTDDAQTGDVDTSVVGRAIEDAGAVIDGYVAKKATVPLDPVPPLIRKICVDLAICNLHARRQTEIPEAQARRCEQGRADLKLFAGGQITLGIQPVPDAPAEAGTDAALVGARPQVFTSAELDKMP